MTSLTSANLSSEKETNREQTETATEVAAEDTAAIGQLKTPPLDQPLKTLQNTRSEVARRQAIVSMQRRYGNSYTSSLIQRLKESTTHPRSVGVEIFVPETTSSSSTDKVKKAVDSTEAYATNEQLEQVSQIVESAEAGKNITKSNRSEKSDTVPGSISNSLPESVPTGKPLDKVKKSRLSEESSAASFEQPATSNGNSHVDFLLTQLTTGLEHTKAQAEREQITFTERAGAIGDVAALPEKPTTAATVSRLKEKEAKSRKKSTKLPPNPAEEFQPVLTEENNLKAVETNIKTLAGKMKKHEPANAKVQQAQQAAESPDNEEKGQAGAVQLDKMSEQKPRAFNRAAFIESINKAIGEFAPKNEDEAKNFAGSSRAAEIQQKIAGQVKQGKEDSIEPVKAVTLAEPDPTDARPRDVKPLRAEGPTVTAKSVGVEKALPKPNNAKELESLKQEVAPVADKMAAAKITDEMLENSGEPELLSFATEKKKAEDYTKTAADKYREQEKQELDKTRQTMQTVADSGLAGLTKGAGGILEKIDLAKDNTKAADENKRTEIATSLEDIYNRTRNDVTSLLDGLDGKVNQLFEQGEAKARADMQQELRQRIDAFWADRKRRYPLAFLTDWLFPPGELNKITDSGRDIYKNLMKSVINQIADTLEAELGKAKSRINGGREEVRNYVDKLPQELKKIGEQAAAEFEQKFSELEQEIDAKADQLAKSVGEQYKKALDQVNELIKKLKDENRGLWGKIVDRVTAIVGNITDLVEMMTRLVVKLGQVAYKIITNPLKFFQNFGKAIGQGFAQFVTNIGQHLLTGVTKWLMGSQGDNPLNLEFPKSLTNVEQWIRFGLSVFGITESNLLEKVGKILGKGVVEVINLIKRLFGMPDLSLDKLATLLKSQLGLDNAVGMLTDIMGFLEDLAKNGLGAFIKLLTSKAEALLNSIGEMFVTKLEDFVVNKLINKGIEVLLSMLTPAGALYQVIKAIVDFVKFLLERGRDIFSLIENILDSVDMMIEGDVSGAANWIEKVLAGAIPLVLDLLARLLGIDDVPAALSNVLKEVRGTISKAIDTALNSIKSVVKPVFDIINSVMAAKDKLSKDVNKVTNDIQNTVNKPQQMVLNAVESSLDKASEAGAQAFENLLTPQNQNKEDANEDIAENPDDAQAYAIFENGVKAGTSYGEVIERTPEENPKKKNPLLQQALEAGISEAEATRVLKMSLTQRLAEHEPVINAIIQEFNATPTATIRVPITTLELKAVIAKESRGIPWLKSPQGFVGLAQIDMNARPDAVRIGARTYDSQKLAEFNLPPFLNQYSKGIPSVNQLLNSYDNLKYGANNLALLKLQNNTATKQELTWSRLAHNSLFKAGWQVIRGLILDAVPTPVGGALVGSITKMVEKVIFDAVDNKSIPRFEEIAEAGVAGAIEGLLAQFYKTSMSPAATTLRRQLSEKLAGILTNFLSDFFGWLIVWGVDGDRKPLTEQRGNNSVIKGDVVSKIADMIINAVMTEPIGDIFRRVCAEIDNLFRTAEKLGTRIPSLPEGNTQKADNTRVIKINSNTKKVTK